MEYITANEVAEKLGISGRRVQLLCKQGRIKGACWFGWAWVIPENADKPTDGRLKQNKKEGKANEI